MQVTNQPYQQQNVNPPRRKLGCAFALLPISAIILLGVGIWYSYTSYMFFSNGVEVQGKVIRLESSSLLGGRYNLLPRFRLYSEWTAIRIRKCQLIQPTQQRSWRCCNTS